MNRKFILILLICFFNSCYQTDKNDFSDYNGDLNNVPIHSINIETATPIELIRKKVFGSDAIPMGRFALIEVDDFDRIYIGDYSQLTIHVLDSEGNYITSMGGRGSGPGELHSISDMKIVSNYLYVYDQILFNLNIYSLDELRISNVKRISFNFNNQEEYDGLRGWIPIRYSIRNDGFFWIGFMQHLRDARVERPTYNLNQQRVIQYALIDINSSNITGEIVELYDSKDITATVDGVHLFNPRPLPFLGQTLTEISGDNHLYTAWSDSFLLKVHDSNGNLLRAIYYPIENLPLHRQNILAMFDESDELHRNLVKNADLPNFWPALSDLLVDDKNRIWVSTIIDEQQHEWWVLNNTRELLARFYWPMNKPIKVVKNGYIYTRETDEETGLQQIVRYRIEMDDV